MSAENKSTIALAFFAFHARVGSRVAVRLLAPIVAALFAAYFILRFDFFAYLADVVFVESGPFILGLILAAVGLAGARAASSRVCYGLSGWMRHLPSDSAESRRMAALAVFIGQTPVLVVLAYFALIASQSHRLKVFPALVGLFFLGLSSSTTAVPARKPWVSAVLGFPACVFFGSGRWPLLGLGLIFLIILDLASGPLRSLKRRPGMRSIWRPLGLQAVISGRAMSWRILVPYALGFCVLGLTQLFLINNGPGQQVSTAAASFGGMVSVTAFLALAASLLAAKRPPWPWSRTLPWSSNRRIRTDSFFLGLEAAILLLPLFWIDGNAALLVGACLPLAAIRSAAAARQEGGLRFGAWGKIAGEGALAALLIALWPWAAAVLALASVPAFRAAVRVEQRSKVSQWLELHHLAAGDSLSWSEG